MYRKIMCCCSPCLQVTKIKVHQFPGSKVISGTHWWTPCRTWHAERWMSCLTINDSSLRGGKTRSHQKHHLTPNIHAVLKAASPHLSEISAAMEDADCPRGHRVHKCISSTTLGARGVHIQVRVRARHEIAVTRVTHRHLNGWPHRLVYLFIWSLEDFVVALCRL